MKYETKFKNMDKVTVLPDKKIVGTCVNIVPHGVYNGFPMYSYVVLVNGRYTQVREQNLELLDE